MIPSHGGEKVENNRPTVNRVDWPACRASSAGGDAGRHAREDYGFDLIRRSRGVATRQERVSGAF
jgi:hypothetical protein